MNSVITVPDISEECLAMMEFFPQKMMDLSRERKWSTSVENRNRNPPPFLKIKKSEALEAAQVMMAHPRLPHDHTSHFIQSSQAEG